MLTTVIIPTFRRTRYLRQAVLSCLREKIPQLEILVVEDGSYCATKILKGLNVRVLRQPHRGQSSAQNLGLKHAHGELIAFLDSDDLLANGGLQWRVEWLKYHPSEMCVSGKLVGVIDSWGGLLRKFPSVFDRFNRVEVGYFQNGGVLPGAVVTTCFRRSWVEKIGGFDESLVCGQDLDFIYRAVKLDSIPYFPTNTYYCRWHNSNTSGHFDGGKWVPSPRSKAEVYLVNLAHGMGRRFAKHVSEVF